ncbi:pilus assembly FimT family protein [Aliivibrio salmonicida]|uniref:pilus assembly FimT family protein n=1 Tax=Aliivibrio salmonicida TaxID=40269 RepID=UPI00406C0CDF
MPRGFTLLELVITIIIIAILLMTAVPNFSRLLEQQNIKRFAGELEGFLIQAKSESVLQNKSLKIMYIKESDHWILSLNPEGNSPKTISEAKSSSITYLHSTNYPHIFLFSKVPSLTFNPVRATPHMPASFFFYKDQNKKLKLSIHHMTGRIRLCAQGGNHYGYKIC